MGPDNGNIEGKGDVKYKGKPGVEEQGESAKRSSDIFCPLKIKPFKANLDSFSGSFDRGLDLCSQSLLQ